MKSREQYYQCSGYYSLAFASVPLATVTVLECLGSFLPCLFGAIGFWFALSGMFKGGWTSRLCGLLSLLMFAHIALVFGYNKFY